MSSNENIIPPDGFMDEETAKYIERATISISNKMDQDLYWTSSNLPWTIWNPYSHLPKHLQVAGKRMQNMGIPIDRVIFILDEMRGVGQIKRPAKYDKSLHKRGRVKKPWE